MKKTKIARLLLLALAAAPAAHAQQPDTVEPDTVAPIYLDELGLDDEPNYYYQHPAKSYRFRVYLKDKKHSPYTLSHPEAFLSAKSLERRRRYGLKLDKKDLPVSPAYVDSLQSLGLRIHNRSKWNNTVVVETPDSTLLQRARQLPFVSRTRLVWISPDSVFTFRKKADRHERLVNSRDTVDATPYGHADTQVRQIHADRLHDAGYRGEGMTIAILDGGFLNTDAITALRGVNILGTRNFVNPAASVFDGESHGTMVLSCIAAQTPHFLVGTAPEASFYLIQTEDGATEQLVEEDNYAAGLEYADSLGADIVTASLGYYRYDHAAMNYHYAALDGQTALVSRSAALAASRGIVLLNSAGNEGDGAWKKIGFPADAPDILTVGAVRADSVNTLFSSLGYTADGRVKPDAMALGEDAAVLDASGSANTANGTSFACPILCGGVACLWQACRDKTPRQIMEAVRQAGNNHAQPNEVFGYGIPDLWKAYQSLTRKK